MKNSLYFACGLVMTLSSLSWSQSSFTNSRDLNLKEYKDLNPQELKELRRRELEGLKEIGIVRVTNERDYSQDSKDDGPLALEFFSNEVDSNLDVSPLMAPLEGGKLGEVITVANELVAVSQNVYNLVSNGRPNSTLDYIPINVVPKKENVDEPVDFDKLWGWQPVIKVKFVKTFYTVSQSIAVRFRYTIRYEYGGKYFKDGVKMDRNGFVTGGSGSYLSGLQVNLDELIVNWGRDFDFSMRLGSITNSRPIHQYQFGPRARAQIILQTKFKNLLKERLYTASFGIDGDGDFEEEVGWGR